MKYGLFGVMRQVGSKRHDDGSHAKTTGTAG